MLVFFNVFDRSLLFSAIEESNFEIIFFKVFIKSQVKFKKNLCDETRNNKKHLIAIKRSFQLILLSAIYP